MIEFDIDVSDVESTFKTLEVKLKFAEDKVSKAVANAIYRESQAMVPVDTGKLKASGRVLKSSDGYTVEYGQGLRYAVIVHNKVSLRLRNGQHFFLTRPARNIRRRLMDAAKAFEKAMK